MAKSERRRVWLEETTLSRIGFPLTGVGFGQMLVPILQDPTFSTAMGRTWPIVGIGFFVVGLAFLLVGWNKTKGVETPPPPTGVPLSTARNIR